MEREAAEVKKRLAKMEAERAEASSNQGQKGKAEEEFIKARRSLKLSPCNNTEDAIKDFLKHELKIPTDLMVTLTVLSCKQVFKRPSMSAQKFVPPPKQIQIELDSQEDRDMIMSHAINLSGGATVEIVVPDRLKILAAKLEHYAYKLRAESKKKSGGDKDLEAKIQVRYDNQRTSLVLAVRKKL